MKEIIENVKLVENAPLEEPARQYYFMEKAKKEYVAEMSEKTGTSISRGNSDIWLSDERSRL